MTVFGEHDVAARITVPADVDLNIFDYSDALYEAGKLRTLETILIRDDLPMYLDRDFSTAHLRKHGGDYVWATIFVDALSGNRHPDFAELFFEAAEEEPFWGCIHLLTAAVTVGRHDSVIEVLASNLKKLQSYVRRGQAHADKRGRDAHTVTYFATHIKRRSTGEF